jgi:large subunit ribosomal protein L25
MQDTTKIKAETRKPSGTKAAGRLRTKGLIPGIIYGHKEVPVAVSLPEQELATALAHGVHLLEVSIDGSPNQVLVKDVQYDYLGDRLLDLTRVSLDERVKVMVQIELRGTPAGVSEGGVLDQTLSELEVECLVTEIPDSIRVRISDLALNQTLRVGDLELPEGVIATAAAEEAVCVVRLLGEEPAEEPTEGAEEPEVIAREKAEEESEAPKE